MKKTRILPAIFLMLVFALGSLALQNGYDQFQKALAKERGEGNLEEAIALYQKVIDETKDEALAAKAQLRIGICYEKLGQEKAKLAQEAFQKVLDRYPNQVEAVKTAREKLSSLLAPQIAGEPGTQKFNIRPLWTDPALDLVGQPRPSQDGKFVSFIDWSSGWGQIAIRDMASGEIRYLTKHDPAEKDEEKRGAAYDALWSPDGRHLAYVWENDQADYVDLRVIGIDNPEPRTLYRVKYYEGWVAPADWSPDGKQILFKLMNDQGNMLGLIPSSGGQARFLREIEGHEPGGGRFSPDGKFIAYSARSEPDNVNHDLFLYSLGGQNTVPLASHPSHDYLLGWTPDGSRILFASDRTGDFDLWILPIKKGMPVGDPSVLIRNIGQIESLGMLQDGSFFFNKKAWAPTWDIYVVTLDPHTGNIEVPPTKVPLPYEGNNMYPAWSPDGKYLAYSSGRHRRSAISRIVLSLYSVETGEITDLSFDQEVAAPHWSPDGLFVLVHEAARSFEIFKVDLETEEISPFIKIGDRQEVHSPYISPDMDFLYFVHHETDTDSAIVRRNLKTDEEIELYTSLMRCRSLSLSPDGKHLAFVSSEDPYGRGDEKRVIKVMASSGEDVKDLYEFTQRDGSGLTDIDWSPDGRYIYFCRKEGEDRGWGLWRILADGGEAQKLDVEMNRFRALSIHPDGRQIAFCSHPMEAVPLGSFWIMENFLPGSDDEGKGGKR